MRYLIVIALLLTTCGFPYESTQKSKVCDERLGHTCDDKNRSSSRGGDGWEAEFLSKGGSSGSGSSGRRRRRRSSSGGGSGSPTAALPLSAPQTPAPQDPPCPGASEVRPAVGWWINQQGQCERIDSDGNVAQTKAAIPIRPLKQKPARCVSNNQGRAAIRGPCARFVCRCE